MTTTPPAQANSTPADKQRAFDLIWSQMPEKMNRHSSSWWFFLFCPEGEEGYGPRQMMFTIASRVGRNPRINGAELAGIDLRRPIVDGVDRFEAKCVGWYCDGETVHHEYVEQVAPAVLDFNRGDLSCLTTVNDETRGIRFNRSATRPLVMEGHIHGDGREAHFEAWGDLDTVLSSPAVTMDIDTPLGGTHYIGWRRLRFEGEFDTPRGRETMRGLGFFQRVLLNVPVFPWKWIWAIFPDGSLFTAYVPYIGLNLFRKGYKFFKSNRLEQPSIPWMRKGSWFGPGDAAPIHFNRATAVPYIDRGEHPQFEITCSNDDGDHVSFLAAPYGHTRFFLDRPMLGGLLESHWSYNEYVFRMENLGGSLRGRPLSRQTAGQAFGSLEYTYGLGL